jgi:hypothetical protein
MKSLLITSYLLLISVSSLFSQDPHWEWSRGAGGSSNEQGVSIAVDSIGNSYVGGFFSSPTISFGSIVLTKYTGTFQSPFLTKYDIDGNVIWAKTGLNGGGTITSVITDPSGNIYCTGYFEGPIILDGIALTNHGSADIFIAKYNPTGLIVWAKSYGGTLDDASLDIAIDLNGNLFITGSYQSPTLIANQDTLINSSAKDYYLLKTDNLGNELWIKGAQGTYAGNDIGENLAVDLLGNIYVTGSYESDSLIISGIVFPQISSTFKYIFMVKYDNLGNLLEYTYDRSISNTLLTGIDIDDSNNVFISGCSEASVFSFGGHTFTSACPPATGSSKMLFIEKFDPSLNLVWANNKTHFASGSYFTANDLTVDNAQNVMVGGVYGVGYQVPFGATTLPSTGGGFFDPGNFLIFKYDSAGNELWAKTYHTSTIHDVVNSLAVHSDGSIFITGLQGPNTNQNMVIYKSLPGFIPVWPGDTDNNFLVNNYDLLPIGLCFNDTGGPRLVQGNLWQSDTASDWGSVIPSLVFDKKHADCNGDGIINQDDTLAVNLNFSQAHAMVAPQFEERVGSELYFVSTSNTYNPGDLVNLEIWAGSSAWPFYNLYGIAFDIQYDTYLVQPGTEKLSYQGNILGNTGVNAISFSRSVPASSGMFGAIVRTDHNNVMNSYGKIANFSFRVNNLVATTDTFNVSFTNFKGINKDGTVFPFTPLSDTLLINSGSASVGVSSLALTNKIKVSPNPTNSFTIVTFPSKINNGTLKIMNVIGEEISSIKFEGEEIKLQTSELTPGIYFIYVAEVDKIFGIERLIIQ